MGRIAVHEFITRDGAEPGARLRGDLERIAAPEFPFHPRRHTA
jgi:hypothetical protein